FRTMWFDPADPKRILLGSDGGLQASNDGGHTSDFFPNVRAGEAYAVGVDMDDPYHVYAGFQDHDSWKGPVNGRWGAITLEDWVTVGPGDGMYNLVDPSDSRWAYNTREMNQMGRMDQQTGVRANIRPPQSLWPERLRYNWVAPIAMSPRDPKTIYAGAQVLFRSRDRGDHWERISPDLTTNDKSKIGFPSTPYCTISSISVSPLAAGEIWVGTDDGKVQLTRDGGGSWSDRTTPLANAGAPLERWVSRVFASPWDAGTAFVSKSGFHNDDFRPYLYVTHDFGQSWSSLASPTGAGSRASELPQAPINVVVQDRKNRHLLFVGNDLGVYVSIDDGAHWAALQANLPSVPVQDLLVHPRENDLVLATYGRALWAGDISPLQELTPAVLAAPVHLFDIKPRARYGFGTQGMNYELYGDKYLRVPDEPDAWRVYYYLAADASAPARLTVTDAAGAVVRSLTGQARRGLN
ncbi:MAG: WD40/YVTN/BNR-like repeat-containing protein, partial [Terriglobales bacterium]